MHGSGIQTRGQSGRYQFQKTLKFCALKSLYQTDVQFNRTVLKWTSTMFMIEEARFTQINTTEDCDISVKSCCAI